MNIAFSAIPNLSLVFTSTHFPPFKEGPSFMNNLLFWLHPALWYALQTKFPLSEKHALLF